MTNEIVPLDSKRFIMYDEGYKYDVIETRNIKTAVQNFLKEFKEEDDRCYGDFNHIPILEKHFGKSFVETSNEHEGNKSRKETQ